MKKSKAERAASVAADATLNDEAPETASQAIPENEVGPPLADAGSDGGDSPQHDVYAEGREALDRLCEHTKRDWPDYRKVALALDAARTEAMKIAGTNRSEGKAYCRALSPILKREGLGTDRLDSKTRGDLFKIVEYQVEIEAFLETRDPNERTLNHPSAILRKWRKTAAGRDAFDNGKGKGRDKGKGKGKTKRMQRGSNLLEEHVELQARMQQLTKRIAEVEQERDQHKREAAAGFTEPAAAITTLVSVGHSLQARDVPKDVKASDLRDLAERIKQLAAEVERLAEETVH